MVALPLLVLIIAALVGFLTVVPLLRRMTENQGRLTDGGASAADMARLDARLDGIEESLQRLQTQQDFFENLLEARPARESLPPGESEDEATPL